MRNVESTLMYRWFEEVWNNGSADRINELLADDGKVHGLKDINHKQDFINFYHNFREQFDNIHVTVHDVISEDDFETARCSVTGTHKESGKPVSFNGMCIARFRDGQIVDSWNNFDFLGMYQQIGQKLVAAEPVA